MLTRSNTVSKAFSPEHMRIFFHPISWLGGVALILGYPNKFVYFPLAIILFPASLFYFGWKANTAKSAFGSGWFTAFLGTIGCLYWLHIPMNDIAGVPLGIAVFSIALLAAYIACYSGLVCLFAHWMIQCFSLKTPKKLSSIQFLPCVFLLGLAWGGAELLLSNLFTGFPWVVLAVAFAKWTPFVQIVSVIGAYALSGVIFCIGSLLAYSFLTTKQKVLPILIACCLLIALPSWGTWRLDNAAEPTGSPIQFGIVQGNIDQIEKWSPSYQHATLIHYLNLSQSLLQVPSWKKPDMLVLPETAMPFFYQIAEPYCSILRDFAREHSVALGFGTLAYGHRASGQEVLYNRLQVVSSTGTDAVFYDKQHLVPFGEYIPFALSIPFLEDVLQGMNFYRGDNPTLAFPLPHKKFADSPPLLGSLICYEAIFPYLAQERVAHGATVLLNISNDGWFGNTSAPLQHLYQTSLRAIEQNRYIVRSTNTGYSCLIDPYGNIDNSGPLFSVYTTTVKAWPITNLTIFHTLKPAIDVLLFCGLVFPFCLIVFRRFFFR